MSNLLPQQFQKQLWAGYRARFVTVGSMLFICVAIITALALLPSYIILITNYPRQTISKDQQQKNDTDLIDLATAQILVIQYGPMMSDKPTTEVVIDILQLRPAGVKVDKIAYTAGTVATLVVSGAATSRESINMYREAIVATGRFKSVTIPVGDLIGVKGGRFTVTISGQF
jgi:hypothetical protein